MTGVLDTSVVVRYLTGDPRALADEAARIIDRAATLYLPDVVLAETAYVLGSVYRIAREVIVDLLVAFVQKRNVAPLGLDKAVVVQGLLLCRPSSRVSFADAIVWAAARSHGVDVVYSFDARFPADGLDVRRAVA